MKTLTKEGEKAKKNRTRAQLYYDKNKEARKKYARKRRKEFPVAALQSKISRIIRTIRCGGFCFICGELEPRFLVEHHTIGRKNNKDHTHVEDITLTLCANCHRKYRATSSEAHTYFIGKAIEKGVMFNEN